MKFPQSSSQSMAAAALASFALIFLWPIGPAVNAQESFFKGKSIVIIQGRDPGGTGDLRVKALFPFLQKYIPGNPTIVSEYMPGGGSRKAANHIFQFSASRRLDHWQL